MGWWKIENTEHVIGDGPLDVLRDAVAVVVEQYRTSLGRLPTKAEWESLLTLVLGAEEAARLQSGAAERLVIDLEPGAGRGPAGAP